MVIVVAEKEILPRKEMIHKIIPAVSLVKNEKGRAKIGVILPTKATVDPKSIKIGTRGTIRIFAIGPINDKFPVAYKRNGNTNSCTPSVVETMLLSGILKTDSRTHKKYFSILGTTYTMPIVAINESWNDTS